VSTGLGVGRILVVRTGRDCGGTDSGTRPGTCGSGGRSSGTRLLSRIVGCGLFWRRLFDGAGHVLGRSVRILGGCRSGFAAGCGSRAGGLHSGRSEAFRRPRLSAVDARQTAAQRHLGLRGSGHARLCRIVGTGRFDRFLGVSGDDGLRRFLSVGHIRFGHLGGGTFIQFLRVRRFRDERRALFQGLADGALGWPGVTTFYSGQARTQ
jgi:hypothetical protein